MDSISQAISQMFPHIACLGAWWMGAWRIVNSAVIAGAYFAIPWGLLQGARKSFGFPLVRWFGVFIAACGVGHLFEAVVLRWTLYMWQFLWDSFTAIVSAITAAKLLALVKSDAGARLGRVALDILDARREVERYPFAAFLCGPDGSNLAVNQAYEDLLGIRLSGYAWERYVGEEDRARYSQGWLDYTAGRRASFEEEITWLHPDGREIPLRVKGFEWAGGFGGMLELA